VLDDALADLGKDERLAVLGCGPGAMMDDLRREVAASYGGWMGQITGDRLEYFEESFTW
jgi:NAD(P)H-flavin reductase